MGNTNPMARLSRQSHEGVCNGLTRPQTATPHLPLLLPPLLCAKAHTVGEGEAGKGRPPIGRWGRTHGNKAMFFCLHSNKEAHTQHSGHNGI